MRAVPLHSITSMCAAVERLCFPEQPRVHQAGSRVQWWGRRLRRLDLRAEGSDLLLHLCGRLLPLLGRRDPPPGWSAEAALEWWSSQLAVLDRAEVVSQVGPVTPLEGQPAQFLRTPVPVLDDEVVAFTASRVSAVARNAMYAVPAAIHGQYSSATMIAQHDQSCFSRMSLRWQQVVKFCQLVSTDGPESCATNRHNQMWSSGWLF